MSARSKEKRKARRALTSPAPLHPLDRVVSLLFIDAMKTREAYVCKHCGMRLSQHVQLKCPFDASEFVGSHT